MKQLRILCLTILAIMTMHTAQAQSKTIAPTTDDEYVMGSVGYKMYMQMKVELKGGYKVNDIRDFEYGDRKASFKGLYRPGEQKPCAIIMLYTKLRGAPEYYCIPTLDAPEILWDRFRVSLGGETDNKQEQLQFFGFALAKAVMLFAVE